LKLTINLLFLSSSLPSVKLNKPVVDQYLIIHTYKVETEEEEKQKIS